MMYCKLAQADFLALSHIDRVVFVVFEDAVGKLFQLLRRFADVVHHLFAFVIELCGVRFAEHLRQQHDVVERRFDVV